jgi:hypothetical protein
MFVTGVNDTGDHLFTSVDDIGNQGFSAIASRCR